MAITLNKLSPNLGAEIANLNLANSLGPELIVEIRQIWLGAGGLLVFRDQVLTTSQHVAFSYNFGPLFGAPGED